MEIQVAKVGLEVSKGNSLWVAIELCFREVVSKVCIHSPVRLLPPNPNSDPLCKHNNNNNSNTSVTTAAANKYINNNNSNNKTTSGKQNNNKKMIAPTINK